MPTRKVRDGRQSWHVGLYIRLDEYETQTEFKDQNDTLLKFKDRDDTPAQV
jgi:hypothetical protein